MPNYDWRGRNPRGELVQGRLDAASENAIATQLLAMGVAPVYIAPAVVVETSDPDGWWARLRRRPVSNEDIMLFSRQMYTLNRAGVPILRALAGLQGSSTKPAMMAMLGDLRASLDQGRDLSTALSRHPDLFNGFYLAMVRMGEMTGRLTEVFLRLTEHMEFEREVSNRIRTALRYPSFVLLAMAIAIVIVNLFVIPVFARVFAGFNTQLPLITRGLLGFSHWMVTWAPLLAVAFVVVAFMLRNYVRSSSGRYRWDRLKLRLPLTGGIVLKSTLARFARSFALSSECGVPMVQALTVVAQTVDNAYIGSRVEQMRDGIERGESITRCAAATGVFTPVVLQMLAVGEETGEVDALLREIAIMYERDTEYSIKGLSASLEPILLAFIGVLVLLLALGVFLPMWNLGQAAMGRGGG